MKRRSRLAFLVALLLAGCGAPPAEPTSPEALGPLRPEGVVQLREVLDGFQAQSSFHGAVAIVGRAGKRVVHGVPEQGFAHDSTTIFPIGSMTKPVVSVVVMQLAEEGSLSLDDSLFDHLPEFAQSQVAVLDSAGEIVGTRPAARGITIADLLAHTSGLCYAAYENGPMGRVYEAAALDTVSGSNRALARALAALPLAFDPGSEWRYGRSTDVLGALIEEVEGASLQAVLVQRVFEPLGMDDTAFFVPLEKRGRLCAGETSGSSAASASEPPLCSAGGGLYSSADDYLRFCEMLLGQGTREDVRILSPASVRLLTTDRIAGLPRPDFLGERGFGLGFAVLTEQSAGPLNGSVGSFHWSGAFGTSFFVDPTEQLIGVFLVHQYRDFSYMVAFRKAVYAALPDYDPGSPSSGNEVGE